MFPITKIYNGINVIASSGDKEDPFGKSMIEFIESQAQKLGMEPKEYYRSHVEIRSEQIAYINAYTQEMFGEPDAYNEDGLEVYNR